MGCLFCRDGLVDGRVCVIDGSVDARLCDKRWLGGSVNERVCILSV